MSRGCGKLHHKNGISRTLILVKGLSTMHHHTKEELVSGNEQTRCAGKWCPSVFFPLWQIHQKC